MPDALSFRTGVGHGADKGCAATGAAITTAAAVGGRVDGARLNSGQLLLACAVAYAQKSLGHDYDDDIWLKAPAVAVELAAQVNTVEAISDPKSRCAVDTPRSPPCRVRPSCFIRSLTGGLAS
ncbi:hypothetical protein ACXVUM_13225 [Williamsia sp. SKLECPSW1]